MLHPAISPRPLPAHPSSHSSQPPLSLSPGPLFPLLRRVFPAGDGGDDDDGWHPKRWHAVCQSASALAPAAPQQQREPPWSRRQAWGAPERFSHPPLPPSVTVAAEGAPLGAEGRRGVHQSASVPLSLPSRNSGPRDSWCGIHSRASNLETQRNGCHCYSISCAAFWCRCVSITQVVTDCDCDYDYCDSL